MKQISLTKVSKSYGRQLALHRVSLKIEAGHLTAIMGPNGAGKSTLLSLLATLEAPSRGEILFDDLSFEAMARRGRRAFGLVSHDGLLYPDLSAAENLRFYGKLYGLDKLEERITARLELVELSGARDKAVRAFSRGMRQRLSIARALLHEPEVLLLDEPFTGLDQGGVERLREIIGHEVEGGRMILLSTHHPDFIDDLCHHLVVLANGRVRLDERGKAGAIAERMAKAIAAKGQVRRAK